MTRTNDPVLVVVDMQNGFVNESDQPLIKAIAEFVRFARQNRWHIVLLELEVFRHGGTVDEIVEEILGYDNVHFVEKSGEDGGQEVLDHLDEYGIQNRSMIVCGVYGDMCVPATVGGILGRDERKFVSVVSDLVWPNYSSQSDSEREEVVSLSEIKEMHLMCLAKENE